VILPENFSYESKLHSSFSLPLLHTQAMRRTSCLPEDRFHQWHNVFQNIMYIRQQKCYLAFRRQKNHKRSISNTFADGGQAPSLLGWLR